MTQPHTDDPSAGLSATGRTADQMHPGDPAPGTTYGDPGGTATADQELVDDAGEESDGAVDAEPEAGGAAGSQ